MHDLYTKVDLVSKKDNPHNVSCAIKSSPTDI